MVSYEFSVKNFVENERVYEKDINEMKSWCKIQNNVPNMSEQQIVLFLMACDNKLEETKKCITTYYSIRSNAPELFDNRDINAPDLKKQLTVLDFCIIPERTTDNHCIILNRISDPVAGNFRMDLHILLLFMVFDTVLYKNPPSGLVLVFDMDRLGFGHILKTKIGVVRKTLHYIQEAMPVKIKAIHVLNSNWYCDKILAIARPFMYKELFNKIYFHTSDANLEDFYEKCVPKRLLPSDYGGTHPSVNELHTETCETLADLTAHFLEEINQRKTLKNK